MTHELETKIEQLAAGNVDGLLPCRKCGCTSVTWWDGRGTCANVHCDECSQEEGVQISDLTDDLLLPRPAMDKNHRYPADIIELAKDYLTNEWNRRAPTKREEVQAEVIEMLVEHLEACQHFIKGQPVSMENNLLGLGMANQTALRIVALLGVE